MTALEQDLRDLLADVETATIGHFEACGFICGVRPVFPARVIGRAVIVAAPGRDRRIIYMAIDTLEPGDVLVIARVDHDDLACVGGGVTAGAKAKGPPPSSSMGRVPIQARSSTTVCRFGAGASRRKRRRGTLLSAARSIPPSPAGGDRAARVLRSRR